LTNAIAYAGHGAVVTVRVRAEADGIVLEVEDDGPGLSPEHLAQARLRKRNVPMRALMNDKTSGYGLGLAITSEIATLFGSDMQLLSGAEGRGLLARLRLQSAQGRTS
jgi:two-component system sensor histidine kinase TctE